MHYAIIIRDKHHKNYCNVGMGFINALAQTLANVHFTKVVAIKYYSPNCEGGREVYIPDRTAIIGVKHAKAPDAIREA